MALGNYINGSTFRGGAFGFKLTSLQKMLEVKQNNGKGTLMHYLVDLLEAGDKKRQELLSFMEDVSFLCFDFIYLILILLLFCRCHRQQQQLVFNR